METRRFKGETEAQYIQRLKSGITRAAQALADMGQGTVTGAFIDHDGPNYYTKLNGCKDLIPHTGYLAVFVGEVARPPKMPENCDHHYVTAYDDHGIEIGARCCKCG